MACDVQSSSSSVLKPSMEYSVVDPEFSAALRKSARSSRASYPLGYEISIQLSALRSVKSCDVLSVRRFSPCLRFAEEKVSLSKMNGRCPSHLALLNDDAGFSFMKTSILWSSVMLSILLCPMKEIFIRATPRMTGEGRLKVSVVSAEVPMMLQYQLSNDSSMPPGVAVTSSGGRSATLPNHIMVLSSSMCAVS
jgi:hypothetical protein